MELQTEAKLNEILGKAMAGAATKEEIVSVFHHYKLIEMKLDEADYEDTFGSEGWRHYFGLPDAG